MAQLLRIVIANLKQWVGVIPHMKASGASLIRKSTFTTFGDSQLFSGWHKPLVAATRSLGSNLSTANTNGAERTAIRKPLMKLKARVVS